MRVLTAEEMREVDRVAIEELGVPGMVLMENAALGVVDALGEVYPEASSAVVFCGPGNNGGDGLAVARHLDARGYRVEIFLLGEGPKAGDAATQLAICRQLGLSIREGDVEGLAEMMAVVGGADVIVDALFGTGLGRPLSGMAAALVAGLDRSPLPRVAVDIPSGLHGSRAEIFGPYLRADLTVTFGALKLAHVFPPAADAMGTIVVADLGVPPSLVAGAPGDVVDLMTAEEMVALLPQRRADAHKGDFGHALILAGSPGKAGAAILAARGAVRAGAGLVTVAVPEPLLPTVDLGSLESMTLALPAGEEGQIAGEAVERVLAAAKGKAVLALGPGLGQEPATAAAIRRLVGRLGDTELPLVIDADGINAFAGRAGEIKAKRGEAVLTPHPGEMGRLLGISTAEVQADRLGTVRRAASETGATVVLKGRLTLVGAPSGEVWVNPTGNAGMATGGMGDVLTGLVAGLMAQGLDGTTAARLGAFVHGLAGDRLAARLGESGLAAGDLAEELRAALQVLRSEG